MKKKIIFFDIDGTLVDFPNNMDTPLPSTIDAFNKLRAAGHYIVIATARADVIPSLKDIQFDGYIFCNGNYIEMNKQVWFDNIFTPDQIEFMANLFKHYNAEYTFGGHHGGWMSSADHPLILRQMELFAKGHYDPTNVDPKMLTWKCEDVIANMATVMFNSEKDMRECLAKVPRDWVVDPYTIGNIRADISLPGFTKGTAVEFVYKKLGIDINDTYAFGDAQNDLEMMSLVGYGVCMGNGTSEMKAKAKYITDSVNKDGIYNALIKLDLIH